MRSHRSIADFRAAAVLHWPEDIRDEVAKVSVLPILLATQDHFISILTVADRAPDAWKNLIGHSDQVTGPLFLKHLMVLSDLGGEAVNKLVPLRRYFPTGAMEFDWRDSSHRYDFKVLHEAREAHNTKLGVTEKKISEGRYEVTPIGEDLAMLILHGANATNGTLPPEVAEKCVIGGLLGQPRELKDFVKQAYIRCSRQVQGGQANALGAITQKYVCNLLSEHLPDWEVAINQPLPGVTHRVDSVGTNFDVRVQSPSGMFFGVEVSFQVTTNSTIERKAREAATVQRAAHGEGHRVCYVIDGAGNINIRDNAIQTLFDHSDMTVAFSKEEIALLANYMREEASS